VFSNGVDAYVKAAKAAGVDGILTLDLPPEEAGEVAAACKTHGVDTVFIVAPTTPDARIAKIATATTGFIYYVSREGVTGVRDQVAGNIPEAVARIRAHTKAADRGGLGIGSRAQVAQVAAHADGVVVGSALVNCIRDGPRRSDEDCAGAGGQGEGAVGGRGAGLSFACGEACGAACWSGFRNGRTILLIDNDRMQFSTAAGAFKNFPGRALQPRVGATYEEGLEKLCAAPTRPACSITSSACATGSNSSARRSRRAAARRLCF